MYAGMFPKPTAATKSSSSKPGTTFLEPALRPGHVPISKFGPSSSTATEEEEEISSDGYLILTFCNSKKARVQTAAFTDVTDSDLLDSGEYSEGGALGTRDSDDATGTNGDRGDREEGVKEEENNKTFYGEAFWIGEEEEGDEEDPGEGGSKPSEAGTSSKIGAGGKPARYSPLSRGVMNRRLQQRGGLGGRQRGHYTNASLPTSMIRCDVCGKYYRHEYGLQHHICLPRKDVWKKGDVPSEIVDGRVVYFCPNCNKPFKWLGNLTRHYYVHTGQRFFRCDICEKEFFSAYQVKRHMNSHTGQRFKCEVCDKPFTCKYACAWHTRQHYTYVE